MSYVERLLTDETTDKQRLEDLVQQFTFENDHQKLNRLASEIAIESTENSIASFAIIYAIAKTTSKNKPEVHNVITGILNYFVKNELIFKPPLLESENQKEDKRKSSQYGRYLKDAKSGIANLTLSGVINQQTSEMLGYLLYHFNASWIASREGKDWKFLRVPQPISLIPTNLFDWHNRGIHQIYEKTLAPTAPPEIESFYRYRKVLANRPSAAFTSIASMSDIITNNRFSGVFDIYKRQFNGISLKYLFETKFDSTNTEDVSRFRSLFTRYLSGVPKGDSLWHQMVQDLFIAPYVAYLPLPIEQNIKDNYKIPHWFEKVFYFYEHLSDQIFLPEIAKFYGENPPANFKPEDINSALLQLLHSSHSMVMSLLMASLERTLEAKRMFNPGANINDLAKSTPFYQLAHKLVPLQTEAAMTLSLIEPWINAIQIDIDKYNIKDFFSLDAYSKNLSESIIAWSKELLGENFLKELRRNITDINEITDRILHGQFDISPSRWGETIADIEVVMEKDSLARKLGVSKSRWQFPIGQDEDINFVIYMETDHPIIEISGFANLQSQTISFNYLDIKGEWSFFGDIMRFVAATTLHDILGRKKKFWKIKKGDETEPKNVIQTEKRVKKLPTSWHMVSSNELIEQFLHPKRNEEKGGDGTKTPTYVNSHIRRIPYGAIMEALINKYINEPGLSTEERNNLLINIRNLRDGTDPKGRVLGQPDTEKIKRMPLAFQNELHPILDPDGNLLHTRTFVAPYFNPRLSSVEYDNAISLFNAAYLSHGSALAYLETLIAEISGMENEVND